MADKSHIMWTDTTWNPVTGCTKISPGCKNCYAERLARRLKAMGTSRYTNGFAVTLHEDLLDLPRKWHRPRRVFVNSMSDLFHQQVPEDFIHRVFATMRLERRHAYQVLTRRSERLLALDPEIDWPENIWMGVSVEGADYQYRIDHLKRTGAKIKFLSLQPLLGPLPDLDLAGIDWVIVGGESGPGARVMSPSWATDIRDQCLAVGVPFFFDRWGSTQKTGRELEGRTWDEMPDGSGRVELPMV